MVPVQIKAQVLRGWPFTTHARAMGPFSMTSEAGADYPQAAEPRKATWRQADIRRAIAAAEQAGLESYRVEIAADGTLSIIVGAPAETAAGLDPSSNLFGS